MTTDDGFTSFESLLLVQTLAAHGLKPETFEHISNSLKESANLHRPANGSDSKFNKDLLKERYLRLLKNEAAQQLRDSTARDRPATNGIGDPTADVGQTLSIRSPTLEDASQYSYLLPQLVAKLYDVYKEHTIREIKEEERRYDDLIKEIDNQKSLSAKSGYAENSQSNVQERTTQLDNLHHTTEAQAKQSSAAALQPSSTVETQPAGTPDLTDKPSSDLLLKQQEHPQPPSLQQSASEASIRSILNTAVPDNAVLQSPKQPSEGVRPLNKHRSSQPPPTPPTTRRVLTPIAPAGTPQFPPLQPNVAGYRLAGDAVHQSPYETLSQNVGVVNSSAVATPVAYSPMPPPSIGFERQLPSAQWSQTAMASGYPQNIISPSLSQPLSAEEIRRQTLSAPMPDVDLQNHAGVRSTPRHCSPGQQYSNVSYSQPQPILSNSASRGGGVILPPFQVTPQAVIAAGQVPSLRTSTASVAQRALPRLSGTPIIDSRVGRSASRPSIMGTPLPVGLSTPLSRTGPLRHPRPDVTFSPGSTTGWKAAPSAPPIPVERPSWTLGFEDAVTLQPEPIRNRTVATGKATDSVKIGKQKLLDSTSTPSQTTPTATAPKRGRIARAPSKTPSVAATSTRTRTRSQSVVSQGEELTKLSSAVDKVIKHEPYTPATVNNEPLIDNKTPLPSKGRRQIKTPVAAPSAKRKRAVSDADQIDPLEAATPRPALPPHLERALTAEQSPTNPTTVTAFRNFQKMTQPIMNNITSHKFASLFANAVKDRDAEGYSDIIHRPQDLKSIRAAIVAGSRTITALTAGDGSGTPGTPRGGASTPGGGSGTSSSIGGSATVVLPWSQDLMPPRAIVNGAQLEQEVMRMFANAVMFNAGNDGVVRDTREMFDSVEASMAAWRAAERNAAEQRNGPGSGMGGVGGALGTKAEDDADELGDVEDSMAVPSAKRRRGA